MRFTTHLTDDALLAMLGERLARLRLTKNLTQRQLAEQAGLGLRTVQRLEQGAAASQLSSFLRICRVLGLAENLELLVPEPQASPIDRLKLEGRKRQRASGRKPAPKHAAKPWNWGESS